MAIIHLMVCIVNQKKYRRSKEEVRKKGDVGSSDFLLEIKGDGPFFGHCEEVTL